MSETTRIADQTRRAWKGEAWHGPGLEEVLSDVTAKEAAAKPIPSAHSILEIVLHLSTWTDIIRRRVEGEDIGSVSDEVDWPPADGAGPVDWEQARRDLAYAHQRLIETVDQVEEGDLDRKPPGSASTRYVMLHGTIQHGLFHAGQIAMLKKAARTLG